MTTSPAELQRVAYERYQAGDSAAASQLCRQLLQQDPQHAEAVYLLGVLAQDAGQLDQAVDLFRQAAVLSPGNPVFVNTLGEASLAQGRESEALACFRKSIALRPEYARAHNNLGRLLHIQDDLAGARASFAEAVRLDPRYATAHNNLGAVLQAQQRFDEAAVHFQQALALRPDYPEAHFNLGGNLQARGNLEAAAGRFQEAIRLRPGYARAYAALGQALVDLAQVAASVPILQTTVRLNPDDATGYLRLGDVLMLLNRHEEALAAFDTALRLQPEFPECLAHRFRLKEQNCDWRTRPAELAQLWIDVEHAIAAGKPAPLHPVYAVSLPWTAQQQLVVARSHAQAIERAAAVGAASPAATPSRTGRLKVAYLSRDFYDHPVAHQVQALFGLHDRSQFEIHAYSFGPNDASTYRRTIEHDCECFHDIARLSVVETEQRIRADGIHILVDLMGYTGFARTQCLARRPAPIQVNWLGYPGTLGAGFIDYFVGDRVVVPPELADAFSERLVRMPHSFMVTDHHQPIQAAPVARRAQGLPDEGVVFCCFNNGYKISPEVFATWMHILSQVPGSVAWLSVRGAIVQDNLRREAAACGVDACRLIFSSHVASKAEHLARQQLADLFLDTHNYNAHATACDALWSGLPLLTCPGETFASRVGASLLTALGMRELIAPTLKEYADRAVALVQSPQEISRLRARLKAQRSTAPLFDTPRFVRNLERAYLRMWEIHASGTVPESFDVVE